MSWSRLSVGDTLKVSRLSFFTSAIQPSARQKLFFDVILLILLGMVLAYLLVSVPLSNANRIANVPDHAWYLNRAHLFKSGIFYDVFVYNAAQPLLTGAVDSLIHDLALAGILVNWIAVLGLILGVYLLGRVFFNRQIAYMAVFFLVTNLAFQLKARTLWPYLLFQTVLVGNVLSYWMLTRYRNILAAVFFGLMLVLALYTRLEGAFYILLVALAFWQMYRTTGQWRLSLRLTAITTIIFALGLGFYLYVLTINSDPSGGDAFTLMQLLRDYPVVWGDLSHRWMETLMFTSEIWPVIAWVVVVAGVIWSFPRFRFAISLFAGLEILNIAYLFGIAIWPTKQVASNSLPFVALLFAFGVWQITKRLPVGRIVALVVFVAVMLPGMRHLYQFSTVVMPDYHNDELYQRAREIDTWLASTGQQNTEIYTMCTEPIPFSDSNFHYLYRLAMKDQQDPDIWWNSPDNLLPYIRDHEALFMRCSQEGWFRDWLAYFADPSDHPQRLVEIHRVDDESVFYEVVDADAQDS